MTDLTLFYIAQPPRYDMMGCVLLASIRKYFPASVKAVGYCPEHMMDQISRSVLIAHEELGAEIRPMRTDGMWDSPYPHGNKILASLQPRDTTYSAFVDSDVMFLRPNSPSNIIQPGHVSCSAAAWMGWTDQSIWNQVYGAFDLPIPEERIRLMRNASQVIPYFSSGFVVFPEHEGPKGRFADIWYETARTLDQLPELPRKRPYLDQLSLPVAILRAGLSWNVLPEEQHFIMGGRQRGQSLPQDREIFTIHYRNDTVLKAAGQYETKKRLVRETFGVRYINRLARRRATAGAMHPKAEQEIAGADDA